MQAGSLEVVMFASLARLSSDMQQAKTMVGGAMDKVSTAVGVAKTALAGLGVGLGIGALAGQLRSLVNAAADLDDLAEKTGASVEELSKLQQQARISDASIETLEMGLVRLSRSLHGTDEEGKGAGKALAALGLSADELRGKDTAESLRIVAAELNKYRDGAGKTALAMDLFGKSGAQLLPLLKDLANDGALQASVTAKQAAEAEELGKAWRRITNDLEVAKQQMALGLVPTMLTFLNVLVETNRETGNFIVSLNAMANAKFFGETNAQAIRNITDELEKLNRQKQIFTGWIAKPILGMRESNLQSALAAAKAFQRAEALAIPGGDTAGEMQRFGLPGAKRTLNYASENKGAKEAKKAAEDVDATYRGLLKTLKEKLLVDGELTEVDRLQLTLDAMNAKQLASITPARNAELMAMARQVDMNKSAKASLEAYVKALEEDGRVEQEIADLMAARQKVQGDAIQSQERIVEQIEFETKLLGVSNDVRETAIALRALETSGLDKNSDAYQRAGAAIKTALVNKALIQEAIEFQRGATSEITEFWRAAAQNMQQSMSSFFFDIMQGNLNDLAGNFKRTVDRMVSDMLAAKAATALFGTDFGKGGDIGGLIGKGLGMIGFGNRAPVTDLIPTGIPAFATGTDFVPRTGPAIVHRGERIIPADENARGSQPPVMNFYISTPDANSFRATKRQIAAEYGAMLR